MILAAPTRSGDGVTTHTYDLLFAMRGPEEVQTYRLTLSYSVRMGRWVVSIYDAAGRTIVVGAPVLHTVELLSYAAPGLRPRGTLTCIWKAEADAMPEPEERDLGAWCEIIYFERVEDLDNAPPIVPPTS